MTTGERIVNKYPPRPEEEEFLEMYKLVGDDVGVKKFYKIFTKIYHPMREYHWKRGVKVGQELMKSIYNEI